MTFHKDLHGLDLHGSRITYGTSSPLGAITPEVAGLLYGDTLNNALWVSTGTTSADWTVLSGSLTGLPSFLQAIVQDQPGKHFFGTSMFDYPNSGRAAASRVQYARVWLPSGLPLTKGETFIQANGAIGRNVNIGLYDQAIPASPAGVPRNLVASTGSLTTNGFVDTYRSAALLAPYTVPANGYYWIAFITDSNAVQYAASAVVQANELNIYRETSAGVVLPPVAGAAPLSNPQSAVAYAAVVE